jgi:ribosome-binding factor A
MDSRRQQQVAQMLQEEMAALFQRHGSAWYGAAFVTLTEVRVTPDLEQARFFCSVYNTGQPQMTIDRLNGQASDIRFQLGKRIRHQVRKVPQIEFRLDDSLDRALRVDELLSQT